MGKKNDKKHIDPESLPYRPCVGIMLLNREGKVFVGRRVDSDPDAWQMPQGGIDEGEAPRDAALREMEEEIGTAKAEIIAESPDWIPYDLPTHLVGKVWKGKYRGQTQKWFCLRFTGADADINLETEHPEFSDWQWVDLDKLPDLIVAFKRETYEKVVETFRDVVKPA